MVLDSNSMTPKAIESYKVAQFCASLNGMGTCASEPAGYASRGRLFVHSRDRVIFLGAPYE